MKPEFRISYMLSGRSQETGTFCDKAKALTVLASYKAWTRAWLQTKQADGNWKTEE